MLPLTGIVAGAGGRRQPAASGADAPLRGGHQPAAEAQGAEAAPGQRRAHRQARARAGAAPSAWTLPAVVCGPRPVLRTTGEHVHGSPMLHIVGPRVATVVARKEGLKSWLSTPPECHDVRML